jgi:hypothetical protein
MQRAAFYYSCLKNKVTLNHMGSTELAANLFRVTQTEKSFSGVELLIEPKLATFPLSLILQRARQYKC